MIKTSLTFKSHSKMFLKNKNVDSYKKNTYIYVGKFSSFCVIASNYASWHMFLVFTKDNHQIICAITGSYVVMVTL